MSNSPVPPRFVPTLTEVVMPAMPWPALHTLAAPPVARSGEMDEQSIQRILQRVDLVLERRLREALGQLISEHVQALAPRLREEIEFVIRDSVSQALAQK